MKTQNSKPKTQNSKLSTPFLWLTLLLCLPIIGPLLQPGYFWGAHDARHSVYFLHQFDKAIQDGVWYPRWAPDFAFGYGYPFFNIYGPLSSYAGEALHLAGLDLVTAVKVVFGLSAILSGLTMYLFVRRLLGPPAGLIAALVYVYIPYHIFDLYVRAALAESVGFVFVPLVLWGFYQAMTRPRLPALLWAALAYAGLMFTSNLLALMFTPILGLYVAYMIGWQFLGPLNLPHRGGGFKPPPFKGEGWRGIWTNLRLARLKSLFKGFQPQCPPARTKTPRPRRWTTGFSPQVRFQPLNVGWRGVFLAAFLAGLPPIFVLGLGLGLSAIFWLPAVLEYRFVRVDQWVGGRFAFGDDFVEIFQLFSPRWGFGASIPGPNDDAGFQIGLVALVLFVISFLIVPKLTSLLVRRTLYFFQEMTIILVFLTTPASYFVWAILPLSTFAQFPWRLLVIIAPLISIVAGTICAISDFGRRPILDYQTSIQNPKSKIQNLSLPLIILASLILLSSYPYIQAQVRDPKPTEGPVSQAALFRFQQSSDEMTGQTAWVRRIPNWSALAEQVERGGQITTKVNYTALPDDNSVGVYSMEMDSVHELLWVGAEKEGQSVTFFVPYYPGWRAYVYEDLGPHDGNLDKEVGPVTRIGPVVDQPEISVTPTEGWMVVPIPPGPHFLEIRFEDTPVRIAGFWISAASVLLWVGLFVFSRRLSKECDSP